MIAKVGSIPSGKGDGTEAWLVTADTGKVLALFHLPIGSGRLDVEIEAWERIPEPHKISDLIFMGRHQCRARKT